MRTAIVVVTMLALPLAAWGEERPMRIDTFDKHSNRTGYLLVNPKTGRVDAFDRFSNRQGSATITPPPVRVQPGQSLQLRPLSPGGLRR